MSYRIVLLLIFAFLPGSLFANDPPHTWPREEVRVALGVLSDYFRLVYKQKPELSTSQVIENLKPENFCGTYTEESSYGFGIASKDPPRVVIAYRKVLDMQPEDQWVELDPRSGEKTYHKGQPTIKITWPWKADPKVLAEVAKQLDRVPPPTLFQRLLYWASNNVILAILLLVVPAYLIAKVAIAIRRTQNRAQNVPSIAPLPSTKDLSA